MVAFSRSGGILLHPTSLPGRGGIGTMGVEAYRFVDILETSHLHLWQVLPLGPTGYGDSPYAALSAFAGNPLLISLDPLLERDLLSAADLDRIPERSEAAVDFGALIPAKMAVLREAFERFQGSSENREDLSTFWEANQSWLDDFALFVAIKDAHGGSPWDDWEAPLRGRDPGALTSAARRLQGDVRFHQWVQFEFFRQWERLKRYANSHGVRIVGDIPIFVAYDSADVWAHQELFKLDEGGKPEVVAGVPPDYFSATGQLWGNPHYRWDVLAKAGHEWWIERFRMLLRLVDIVRLDHFRGFAGAWEVPYGDETAERGEWVPGPGAGLFEAIRSSLGELPIIAEDLGVITPDVVELRERFQFPGMIILQFAFASDASDPGLPHNLHHNLVVYTGTHDNDTTVGWYTSRSKVERTWVRQYLGSSGLDISWAMIQAAFSSVADLAIVPLQDVLRLGTSARMNWPGRSQGNWTWRFKSGDITEVHQEALLTLAKTFGRDRVPDSAGGRGA